ncbi:MAG: NADH-quinone oxidoreductase subunit NuoF [Armatimonadetes bacterium]|nr:NADH-quinone oxidoreductase subunit NuoF [Armatimonadota bacterium]
MEAKTVFVNTDVPGIHNIDVYTAHGGYEAFKKALGEMAPEQVVEIVLNSGLRGRGGAGFPTGRKWGSVPKDPTIQKYVVVNADEGEPGTFKDREILNKNPHELIEGIALAAYAVGATVSYIYIRGEFVEGYHLLEKALKQAYAKGFLGKNILGSGMKLDIYLHRGAGSYECGEETALMNSLEGGRGNPRLKFPSAPFPTVSGIFKKPTVINNVETLCAVPHIVKNGADWYKQWGTERSPGSKIFSVSGHVKRPGNYDLPLGTSLRTILYDYCGGIRGDRQLKAVIPGGSSTPIFRAEQIDVAMDYESVAAAGSMLGSGAIIVMDETTCIVWAAWKLIRFYAHESCGKCTPCREGTYWLEKIVDRIEYGSGRPEDLDLMLDVSDNISGKAFCPFGDAAIAPIVSTIKQFRSEWEYHIQERRCLVENPYQPVGTSV